jgi:hypothetical protein
MKHRQSDGIGRRTGLQTVTVLAATALAVSACGGSSEPAATSGSPSASATSSTTPSTSVEDTAVEIEESPTLSAAEEAAWSAYPAHYFDRLPVTSSLYGDNFVVGPLTEVIDLCDGTVAPASSPVAAKHAISTTGGSLSENDQGTVTRSVAVYGSYAGARTTYDAIAAGLADCGESASITPLDLDGMLAWRRTGYSAAPESGSLGSGVAQVWTATVEGRTLLVQYESLPSAVSATKASSIATALMTTSERLRSKIAEKIH